MIRIEPGNCLEVIPRLVAEGVVVDSVVTDPPYGLEFMGKEWDKFRINSGSSWSQKRATGKDWKGQERERPGWLYMRSSHQTCQRCGKQKHQHDDEACDPDYKLVVHAPLQMIAYQAWCEEWAREALSILRPGGFLLAFGGTRTYHRLVCGLEDAGFVIQDTVAWLYGTGFPKHKSHLKPAFEPIVLAYKPGGKRTMQIDECRIGLADNEPLQNGVKSDGHRLGEGWGFKAVDRSPGLGRWPANVCHDGSDEVLAAFPDSAGQQIDLNGGEPSATTDFIYGDYGPRQPFPRRGDSGSAARFFFSAKAGKADRLDSRHPTVKPVVLMQWLVRLVTPDGGLVLDPFAGTGNTGVAAETSERNSILIEMDPEYEGDIDRRVEELRLRYPLLYPDASPVARKTPRRLFELDE